MLILTIFKPTGETYRTISSVVAYSTQGPLLTATFTPPNGSETSIRTTLPFLIEESASEDAIGFKA
jgi:hypothetical protein